MGHEFPQLTLTIQRGGNRERIRVELDDRVDHRSSFIQGTDSIQQVLDQRNGRQPAAGHFFTDTTDAGVFNAFHQRTVGIRCLGMTHTPSAQKRTEHGDLYGCRQTIFQESFHV